MSNKLGKRKHVEKPGRIGFQVLSHQKKPRKKRVRWNLMMVPNRNTIWRPQSHVNTIKKATSFFYKDQKRCKGRQFHRCFGLQATKISGTVVPSWPCFFVWNGFLGGFFGGWKFTRTFWSERWGQCKRTLIGWLVTSWNATSVNGWVYVCASFIAPWNRPTSRADVQCQEYTLQVPLLILKRIVVKLGFR